MTDGSLAHRLRW